jgi:uncharacterized protein
MLLTLPSPTSRRLIALAAAAALLAGLVPGLPAPRAGAVPAPGAIFISEFHYDNASGDVNEFVEVTAPAGTDLSGWSVVLYNGSDSETYDTAIPLSGIVPDEAVGYGAVDVDAVGLQNGSPDGIALVDAAGAVVEFLSYEGVITAADGPAATLTSTDVGATESSSTSVDGSVKRTGFVPSPYAWNADNANSRGLPNPGLTINGTMIPNPDDPGTEICETTDLTAINAIQGAAGSSPLNGDTVTARGVVTADFTSGGASGVDLEQGLGGFFLEALAVDRDTDAATSEGVFVSDANGDFTGEPGDVVYVIGEVDEFFGLTQVVTTSETVCDDSGSTTLPAPPALPIPVALGDRSVVYEPMESMRVTVDELHVVEFFEVERFGEIRLSSEGVLDTPTNVVEPGAPALAVLDANQAATFTLDDGRTGQNLDRVTGENVLPYVNEGSTLRIGDRILNETLVLHFGFGEWKFQPLSDAHIDELADELVANRTRPRPQDPPDVGGTMQVASFNVLNYFDGDGQGGGFPTARGAHTPSELARQTEKLVDAITRLDADVYGLIEIENDGGEFNATRTLVEALNAHVGSSKYAYVNTGVIGTDAIKQAFVYNRQTVRPVGNWAILTSAVDPRFNDDLSRPALAQTFLLLGSGERVTVVVNHLKSKSDSDLEDESSPDFDQGDGQGFWNHSRTLAAEALADWLATNPTKVQSLGTLIIGDLNAYAMEDPIQALEDAGFVNQLTRFQDPGEVAYTYTFDGMQGALDTALATGELGERITDAAVWHINADEVPAIDYVEEGPDRFRTAAVADAYYDPSAFRSSDHDPVVVGLDLDRNRYAGPHDG